MERSEEELRELAEWRQKRNLSVPHEQTSQSLDTEEQPKAIHFFNYNPELGPTDLSRVSLRHNETNDKAVFSIPLKFTNKAKTVYKKNDKTEFGFDIRVYLSRDSRK